MFRFLTINKDYSDRVTGARSVEAHIICDSVTDLPNNTAELTFLIGSKADVIQSGAVYKINTSGVWILQPNQSISLDLSEYYKSAQVDSLIAPIQSAVTSHDSEIMALSSQQSTQHTQIVNIQNQLPDFTKIFQIFGGVGATIIESGENLNTSKYVETGCYICENSATAASLQNCPVNYSGFVMLVYSSGNKYRIILPTSGGITQMYIETVTGGGSSFNAWYKLVGQNV